MNLASQLRTINAVAALDLVARALEIIGKLAGSTNRSNATDVILTIRHVYDAVVGAAEERIMPEEAMAELDKLENGIRDNDGAADAAVDRKFNTSNDRG